LREGATTHGARHEPCHTAHQAALTAQQRLAIGSNHGAILARVWENTAKVALIRAVSANPSDPVIRFGDAEWARRVVDRCVATMLREAERHIADNQVERNYKRVLEIISSAGVDGITRQQLYDRTRFLTRRDREDILATLTEAGKVEFTIRQTTTRPASIYRRVV
jgi:hypothetical protein